MNIKSISFFLFLFLALSSYANVILCDVDAALESIVAKRNGKKVKIDKRVGRTFVSKSNNAEIKELDDLAQEAKSLRDELWSYIKPGVDIGSMNFPKEFVRRFNDNTLDYQMLLEVNDVMTRTNSSRVHPEFLNIEILSTGKTAPKPFQLYYKAHKKLNGNELVVSNFENGLLPRDDD